MTGCYRTKRQRKRSRVGLTPRDRDLLIACKHLTEEA